MTMLEYKVVEESVVTDESLEKVLNEWVARGWQYDGMQFAMRDGSKRPAMAFIFFTRCREYGDHQSSQFSSSR